MPPRLTKPTTVPEAREPLIDLLWRFYRAAQRPPIRRIAQVIEELPEEKRNGSANHETIRRTLRGEQIGAYQTVEVIFLALCELADVDPQDADDVDDQWSQPDPYLEQLQRYWNQAIDEESAHHYVPPKTRSERELRQIAAKLQQDDPWGSAPPRGGGFADEPPF
ncbi:hypothetical protein ACSHWB_43465 [Lentzea sp. HUAS TT2]|uniref:hypothetical protein n=1 Tax=Lentzea sp. HUAS TT2 TaxID=3447454 RepID=UPI003F72BDD9